MSYHSPLWFSVSPQVSSCIESGWGFCLFFFLGYEKHEGEKSVTHVCSFGNLACSLPWSRCSINTCEGNWIWSPKNTITINLAKPEGKMLPIQKKENGKECPVPRGPKVWLPLLVSYGENVLVLVSFHMWLHYMLTVTLRSSYRFWLLHKEADAFEKAPDLHGLTNVPKVTQVVNGGRFQTQVFLPPQTLLLWLSLKPHLFGVHLLFIFPSIKILRKNEFMYNSLLSTNFLACFSQCWLPSALNRLAYSRCRINTGWNSNAWVTATLFLTNSTFPPTNPYSYLSLPQICIHFLHIDWCPWYIDN